MLSKYVSLGDKIDIVVNVKSIENSDSVMEKKNYVSQVYDIISEDEVVIYMPMEHTKLILLPLDGEYEVHFYTKRGLYKCNVKVTERFKVETIYLIKFELKTELRKYQRREYYRLNCILNMKCREFSKDELQRLKQRIEVFNSDIKLINGIVVDISGGGARFVTQNKFEIGSYILFIVKLKVNAVDKEYNIVGKVLRSELLAGKDGQCESRIQFIGLNHEDREGIIHYIFEEERKLRRKDK